MIRSFGATCRQMGGSTAPESRPFAVFGTANRFACPLGRAAANRRRATRSPDPPVRRKPRAARLLFPKPLEASSSNGLICSQVCGAARLLFPKPLEERPRAPSAMEGRREHRALRVEIDAETEGGLAVQVIAQVGNGDVHASLCPRLLTQQRKARPRERLPHGGVRASGRARRRRRASWVTRLLFGSGAESRGAHRVVLGANRD